ncbi:Alcohol_dehydrogenase [Hexamita inflata]|uniref:Alcohol_dehydrogenase n=1 Tax=Hexamita inflata TaxID=28002 RepID=A0ABP1KSY1_9EUKA
MQIDNFQWFNPTKLIVKHDASGEIADYISADGIQSVLLAYGQASVKKIGVYDQVINSLNAKNIQIYELPGVRANPELQTVIQGIDICRKNNIQAVLPLQEVVQHLIHVKLLPQELFSIKMLIRQKSGNVMKGPVKLRKLFQFMGCQRYQQLVQR